jgi:hypothetical protein
LTNILALNAFCHHDITVLPIGVNSTVTQTLGNPTDTVSSALSAIPVVGNIVGAVVNGFTSML